MPDDKIKLPQHVYTILAEIQSTLKRIEQLLLKGGQK